LTGETEIIRGFQRAILPNLFIFLNTILLFPQDT